jgi:hypothetical protein
MYYRVTLPENNNHLYLDGDSLITPDNLIKGKIIKKNTSGGWIRTGRKIIIRYWIMVEIIGDTQAGF